MSFNSDALPRPVDYHSEAGRKIIGPGAWFSTSCHGCGGSDPMRVNRSSGGYVCMNCDIKGGDVLAFHMDITGMEFMDAAKSLGAWVDDGKPVQQPKPTPVSARQAVKILAAEANLAAVAAGNVARGVVLTDIDLARLMTASNRITRVVEMFA